MQASGSEQHKPQHVAKPMHPKMIQRAAMVKDAHQHLAATVPEYHQVGSRQKFMMAQHHINVRLGKVK